MQSGNKEVSTWINAALMLAARAIITRTLADADPLDGTSTGPAGFAVPLIDLQLLAEISRLT